jgi:hypothetical protein
MPKVLLFLLLLAAPLLAGDGYRISPESGVGQLKRGPYLPVRVRVARNDPQQSFAGRIVAQVHRYSRTTTGEEPDHEYTVEFSMAAGVAETVVLVNMPFNGTGLNANFVLERRDSSGRWEIETEAPLNESPMNPDTKVIGFISTGRLEAINPVLADFALLEIPTLEMMPDWKALLAYDAILVNTEQLTREQYEALVEYVSAGGTLIISPRTAASFNPGQPAGELLGIPSTVQSREEVVRDYAFLGNEISTTYSAVSQLQNAYAYNYPQAPGAPRRKPRVPPQNTPANTPAANAPAENAPAEASPEGSAEATPDGVVRTPPVIKLPAPASDATFTFWPQAGRARPADFAGNLVSVARVGAGMVVFIHTDVSRPPFTQTNDAPSLAGANLISAAFKAANARGLGHTPLNLICNSNGRQLVDIAGHRIPGNSAMIIAAFLYILAAGVGVFFLARKLRRPELYPAGLVAFGVISVVGVFGLGNWFKRSGERVNALRIVVSDNVSGRAGTFSVGCAYVPSGGEYQFSHGLHGSLAVAGLETAGSRGMPNDLTPSRVRSTGNEAFTKLKDLQQFQNVLFVAQEPRKIETLKFNVSGTEGALKLSNDSDFDLRGCIVLVGKINQAGGAAQWHYVPRLQAQGGAATLTASTTALQDIAGLRERLEADLGAGSLEFRSLMTLLRRVNSYSDSRPPAELEGALVDAGLMPALGEVLVISVLPADALSVQSLGTPEEPGDVRQACVWCVRCVIP